MSVIGGCSECSFKVLNPKVLYLYFGVSSYRKLKGTHCFMNMNERHCYWRIVQCQSYLTPQQTLQLITHTTTACSYLKVRERVENSHVELNYNCFCTRIIINGYQRETAYNTASLRNKTHYYGCLTYRKHSIQIYGNREVFHLKGILFLHFAIHS